MALDPVTLAIVAGTFLLAGLVKGVIGLGLPTVSLALLTATMGLPQAMALLLVPSFVTNVWQALVGGNFRAITMRIWPFLVMATVTVWIGALALTRLDVSILSAMLGCLLIVYAVVNLAGIRIAVPARHEVWAGPVIGATNGVLTGMTGSFVVPGVMFLQAIGLPRDMLVQAMGMLFALSTLALAIALGGSGLLSADLGWTSALAVVPAIGGMMLGQAVRGRLSETMFRRVFFIGILLMGLYIVAGAL
ncbi:sulfite exporter TauE/SafE family protein [Mesorhizobium sp. CAU 1732]|uniref:sulfite exporter TauE/SafE family protein n=1 Tax=Mesorhizobium sp. CAU 1732 TaxID=3140358 RepID=UPI0032610E10